MGDTASLIYFASLAAAVAVTSAWLTRVCLPVNSPPEMWLRASILGFAQIIGSALALGLLGLLSAPWFAVFHTVLVLLAAALRWRRPLAPARWFADTWDLAWWPNLALLFAVFVNVVLFTDACLLPPIGTDSLIYHLVFPTRWLQEHRLTLVTPFFFDHGPGYAPVNLELLCTWLMAPFSSDVLARFAQVPCLITAALGVHCVAIRLGSSRQAATVAAALTLLSEPLVRETLLATTYNDVAVAAFLVAAIYSLLCLVQGERRALALLGLATGLGLGTKYPALVWFVPTTVACLGLLIGWRVRHDGPRIRVTDALAASALLLALAGYTYIRNWIVTGNPMFPADVKLAGVTLFTGLFDPALLCDRPDELRRAFESVINLTDDFAWKPFPTAAMLLLAGVGLIASFRRTRRTPTAWLSLILSAGLPICGFVLYVLLIPTREGRMLLPLYAAVIPLAALGLHATERWRHASVLVALACLVLTVSMPFARFAHPDVLLRALMALGMAITGVGGVLRLLRTFRILRERLPAILLFSAGLVGIAALSFWPAYVNRYQSVSHALYETFWGDPALGWRWIEEQTRNSPACIAVVGAKETYPLYGLRHQNTVTYVPIQRDAIHHYHQLAAHFDDPLRQLPNALLDSYRSSPSEEDWLRRIDALMPMYLFVAHRDDGLAWVEETWYRKHPARFRRAFSTSTVEILAVTPRRPPPQD